VPRTPAYRSAIDLVVGAPAEELPVGQSGLRAEANKSGDPAPVPVKRPKRVRQAKEAANPGPEAVAQATRAATLPPIPQTIGALSPMEPGALNFAWIRGGKTALLPLRAYDDGRATYLVWGGKQTVPDVQVTGAQGEQLTAAMTRHENSIVILSVPSRIVLRAGASSATLDNLRLARLGAPLAGPVQPGPAGASAQAGVRQ
jgi:type IV secretion system protein VirB9